MSNAKIIEGKKKVVDEIADKLKNSVAAIVVNYRGLSVAEVTELRKQLREADVDYKVYKNTFARRATALTDMTSLDEALTGPTAISFSKEDVISPAKILYNFAKDHEALEIKAGVIEGKPVSIEELQTLAKLPTREELLSMLANVLQAPIRKFAIGVKAVADKKEQQEA
ncbi:50S ribosomal protein L10 [Sporolactobacillus sp. Y61]|jgi:large subunit ribosomal protein L10|uniref:Large ribosomal subunit protein uL10 n=1 Tax=Sporolactobacillus sp. Y61 TaxID=3160863 RepID=A0AAU8IH64_9BACL|nr:50S ribosomal protein L10 [Sporolactobacillus sp. THM19-2]RYL89367.1 50S ribosomal protein L10 [Sporolactobacillus sp. THM19-2]